MAAIREFLAKGTDQPVSTFGIRAEHFDQAYEKVSGKV
jgi:hypothetical protein